MFDFFSKTSARFSVLNFKMLTFLFCLFPSLVFAEEESRILVLIRAGRDWVAILVEIVIFLGLLFFLWGVTKYITSGVDEEKRQEGRNLMLYGIIGLFVMVAVWGLVYVLGSLIGIKPGGDPEIPTLPGTEIVLGGSASQLTTIILQFHIWISYIVYFLIGLTLLFFLWGVAKYILSGADSEKRTEGRNFMIYGIAGLFVMVAVWGLVYFVGATVGIAPGGGLTIPQITDDGATPMNACVPWDPATDDVSFKGFVCLLLKFLNPIPPILITLSLMYFFWGIAKYIKAGGDQEELKSGKNTIIYGIIGLFVILALWGLVYLIQRELLLF